MELFEEIYSTYFQVVRKILIESAKTPLRASEMTEISNAYAFEESALSILPKLLEGSWSSLLKPAEGNRYTCALNSVTSEIAKNSDASPSADSLSSILKTPITHLQKSWLKALLFDARFRLFFTEDALVQLEACLKDTEPLYQQSDFHFFDQYADSDSFEDAAYRTHFQTILQAMKLRRPLFAAYESAKSHGNSQTIELLPCRLQYSAKDDKFRLLSVSLYKGRPKNAYVLNLGRILACHLSQTPVPPRFSWDYTAYQKQAAGPVRIRISKERNALERCMLHFANYEKHTEYEPSTDGYLCSIYYDSSDETELLIQLLSFGPVIEILGPEPFLDQVRERVVRQHELFYGEIH